MLTFQKYQERDALEIELWLGMRHWCVHACLDDLRICRRMGRPRRDLQRKRSYAKVIQVHLCLVDHPVGRIWLLMLPCLYDGVHREL